MGRLIAKILAWLAILLGLALLIQPTAAQWWTSTRNAKNRCAVCGPRRSPAHRPRGGGNHSRTPGAGTRLP